VLRKGPCISLSVRRGFLKDEDAMSAVTKKPAKSRRPKSLKKAGPPAPSDFEAPVLFRLPDLTEVHFVSAEPAIQYTSAVIEHAEPATRVESKSTEPPIKPTAGKRTTQATQFVVLAAKRNLVPALIRLARIPYAAPVGLVGASLLTTLGLIYLPWSDKPPFAQATQLTEEVQTPLPAAKSTIVDTNSSDASMDAKVVGTDRRPLRKIADQLDQQLTESESQDLAIADSVDADASTVAVSPEKDDSFTEPWWRIRPAGHRNTAQVAANEPDAIGDQPEDESSLELADEPTRDERVVSPRTAMRKHATDTQKDGRYNEVEEEPRRTRNEDRQYEADVEDLPRDRRTTSEARSEEAVEEVDIAESPWRRIRNERRDADQKYNHFDEVQAAKSKSRRESLDRELEHSTAKSGRPTKKPQYRSPPGQEIDLTEEWPIETASRPRTEPKRNGLR
jgi:hypothetical protein